MGQTAIRTKPKEPPLPAPTRAKREEGRKAPPYKWLLLGGGGVVVFGILVLAAAMLFALNLAKDYGYDTNLSKKYPELAIFVVTLKRSNWAEDIKADSERGIVTFRNKRNGKRYRVQEKNGTIGKFEEIDEKGRIIGSAEEAPFQVDPDDPFNVKPKSE